MADVDRRGCADEKQDAEETKENNTETHEGQDIKVDASATMETSEVSTVSDSGSNDESTQIEIKKSSEIHSPEIMSSNLVEKSNIAVKTDENLEAKLLKAREELNRARDELAQAKTEVQKAKQELTSAEADPNQASKSCSENIAREEENLKPEITRVEDSTPSNEQENTEIVTSVNTTSTSTSESGLSTDKSGTNEVPEVETTVSESQKEESILQKDQSTEGDNQSEGDDKNVHLSANEAINETGGDLKSTVEGEVLVKEETPEDEDGRSPSDVEEEGNGEDEELEEGEEEHSDEDEDILVEGEREEGDGEESENAAPKALDDDEDRRNPQYIPKRGGFYEHDDRTREEGEEVEPAEPVVEEKPKKGLRSEAIERWGHDMFDENQQGPKSEQELYALYGYDIRKEEGAPRARRRRRYGRGPNKYSRTWTDEDAYSKPSHSRGGGSARGGGAPKSVDGDNNTGTRNSESESASGPLRTDDENRTDGFPRIGDSRGRGGSRGGKEARGGVASRGGGESRGGIALRGTGEGRGGLSRGSPRGGGTPRGGRGRFRDSENNTFARNEDFPPLNTFKADQEQHGELASGSSANWRESASRDNNRGGGVAISFRRGGGGRTFEERNSGKAVKGRGDHMESPSHFEERKQDDAPNYDSPSKDGNRSIRGTGTPRGGPPSRGFSRGGRGGASAGDKNWSAPKGREAETKSSEMFGSGDHNEGARAGIGPRPGSGPHSASGQPSSGGSHHPSGPHQATGHHLSGGPAYGEQGKPTTFHAGEHRPRGGGRPSGRIPESSIDMTMANMQRMRIEENASMSGPQNRPQDAANAARSKRYSSQRQRMTSPPPPPTTGGVVMQPPYVPNVGSAYYASYNDSPPPNYPPTSTYPDTSAPMLPLVGAQGAPPPFIAPPIAFPGPSAPASFPGGYQGYPPAPAPPQVGVPIGSPTQDMYAGGIMYYNTERQTNRHASQPMRRAKAAIPIVAPDTDVDNLLVSGGRYIHE